MSSAGDFPPIEEATTPVLNLIQGRILGECCYGWQFTSVEVKVQG